MGIQPLEVSSVAQGVEGSAPRNVDVLGRRWVKTGLFLLGDLLALGVSYSVAFVLAADVFHVSRSSLGPPTYPFFFIPFCAAIFYLMDGYGMVDLRRPERELQLVFKGVSFFLVALLAANAILFKGDMFSRYFVFLWYFLALGGVLAVRSFLRGAYVRAWGGGCALNRALFVGQELELLHFQRVVAVQRHRAYQIVAAIVPDGLPQTQAINMPMWVDRARWKDIVEQQDIQVVILGGSQCRAGEPVLQEFLSAPHNSLPCLTLLADISLPSGMHHEYDHFTGSSYLTPIPRWHQALHLYCKRGIDVLFGLAGSVITVALMPIIKLLISFEDPGPVFHLREYVSQDGTTRYYRKFRTMVCNADEILQKDEEMKARFAGNHKLRDDPRVLRIGRILRKYSIDEFPQFFSVLRGHLSLVGPRVISQAETERYGSFLLKRLSVKPGMTGYWQVMGRQTTTYNDRVQMDEFYIDHWSIWMDLYIIAKTFGQLFSPEGAY